MKTLSFVYLRCSATNFLQTIFLSMVTAFTCMVMTAKSASHSVVIVLQSQVWISKLPIGRMPKIFKFLLKFHIVVVQQQQRNVQNSIMHVQNNIVVC